MIKKLTDQELRDLIASLAVSQKETAKQMKETDKRMKETDKQLKELGKQIGGIGEKFGYFTEGMALPSMERILRDRFGMEVVLPRATFRDKKTGQTREIDVIAYANSDINEVYVVEIKSKLREEGIKQVKKTLDDFFSIFPDHKGKKLYGIVAAIDSRPRNTIKKKVLDEGIYYAEINDDTFQLKVPESFEARSW